jgi:hypothetical protein
MEVDVPDRVGLPDARPLFRLVRRTRVLLRSTRVATGSALTAGLFLGALAAAIGLDLLIPLPTWLRLTALLAVVGPPLWVLGVRVARPLFRRMPEIAVARRIEGQLPGIHNRLVSCIDLAARDSATVSPTFHRRLITEALDRIRGFRPRQVLDLRSLRRAGVLAVAAAAALAILYVLFPDRAPTAAARVFRPFADIPPASGVEYTVAPGDADSLREDSIVFAAQVTKGQPDGLRLELAGTGGAPLWFDLTPDRNDPSRWKASLDTASLGESFRDGFHYRVHGGGTWSRRHEIRLVERPVLVEVRTAVRYPEYMGIPEPRPTPPQATRVTGPEGGEVEVTVCAEGQVAAGEVQLLTHGQRQIPAEEQVERVWVADKPPAGATPEGTWAAESRSGRAAHTEPPAVGPHGHWFQGDPAGHAVTPGDILFAYAYLSPSALPESILLEWNDGDGWEHRAYWGQDLFRLQGKAGTASRLPRGPLPEAGRWVRLEVPASAVGLEGKTLRGMAFRVHGGQAAWGTSGTVRLVEPTLVVAKAFPMAPAEGGEWSGRFPLTGSGLFRAELKNQAGHPNKPMKELEYAATPDQPPQVALERPGEDLIISQPAAVPLTVTAFDDYGLERIDVLTRASEGESWKSRTLFRFPKPERSRTIVAPLTEAAGLKKDGLVRYVIEARDRKGQTARTRELSVRVAADGNAADRRLADFERGQDDFRDRLVRLIAEQKKVQTDVEKLNREYANLTAKVKEAEAQANAQPPKIDPATGKPLPPDLPALDPETAKRLAEVQRELARLGQLEQQNAATADQMAKDLAKSAEDAAKLGMLPAPVSDQMRGAQQAFEQMVARAMQDFGRDLGRSADPKTGDGRLNVPDLAALQQKGARIAEELQGARDRLEALAKGRKALRDDLAKALQDLKRQMAAADGELTARELEELRDFIAKLRTDLKDLQGREDALADESATDPARARAREETEKDIEKGLADARNLLNGRKDRPKRRPQFPESPFSGDEVTKVPPREEDSDEPLPNKTGSAKPGEKAAAKPGEKKEDDEAEKLYMPALGGAKEKVDPRFAKKVRPNEKGKRPTGEHSADDLGEAERSLASDQNVLESMAQRLRDSARGARQAGDKQNSDNSSSSADSIGEMLRSQAVREALAMAGRMRQGGRSGQPGQPGQPGPAAAVAGQAGPDMSGVRQGQQLQARLAALDPGSRAAILKLPPRLREELLQGMEERGPEGYGPFIQNYFRRLSETSGSGK